MVLSRKGGGEVVRAHIARQLTQEQRQLLAVTANRDHLMRLGAVRLHDDHQSNQACLPLIQLPQCHRLAIVGLEVQPCFGRAASTKRLRPPCEPRKMDSPTRKLVVVMKMPGHAILVHRSRALARLGPAFGEPQPTVQQHRARVSSVKLRLVSKKPRECGIRGLVRRLLAHRGLQFREPPAHKLLGCLTTAVPRVPRYDRPY